MNRKGQQMRPPLYLDDKGTQLVVRIPSGATVPGTVTGVQVFEDNSWRFVFQCDPEWVRKTREVMGRTPL
jgi:GMP synthase-like glutamine amidotransferase